MTLTDKEGSPLTRQEWLRLISDRAYCTLARVEVGGVLVTASWLGVSVPSCPETFCLRVERSRKDFSGQPALVCADAWYGTEAKAVGAHAKTVGAVRSGAFGG